MATLPAQKQSNSNKKDTHLKTSPSNTTEGSSKEIVIEQVTVNVFFDGTKNNLYNTDTYNNSNNKKQYEKSDDYESYTNAYSNVAHLYQGRPASPKDMWIYIDGIGSFKDGKDDQDGFAYGRGRSGIVARALRAFENIKQGVRDRYGANTRPNILKINVFGFSRGAATARHFVHLAKKNYMAFFPWKFIDLNIQIKFVGLFDTVSSYDPRGSIDPDFTNDVGELHLNFSEGYADKVFHLCALDEYRIFFSLTDIESARRLGCGYEVYLPGAHADIGGSYADGKPNSYPVTNDPVLKKWFYEKGYFTVDDLVSGKVPLNPRINATLSEVLTRKSLSNTYYKVPLKSMRLMAEKEAKISFLPKYFNDKNQNSGQVGQLLAQIPKAIISKTRWKGGPEDFSSLYQDIVDFRHKYVHWSARYELGYHLRRGNKGVEGFQAVMRSDNGLDRQELPFRKKWPG